MVLAVVAVERIHAMFANSFWFDEVFSVRVPSQALRTFIDQVAFDNGNMLGFLTALRPVATRLPDGWLRTLFAFVPAALAVALAGRSVRRGGSEPAALLGAVLLGTNPVIWHYSGELRAYGAVLLAAAVLLTASTSHLVRSERTGTLRLAFASGCGAWLSLSFLWTAALPIVVSLVVIEWVRHPSAPGMQLIALLKRLAVHGAAVVLPALPIIVMAATGNPEALDWAADSRTGQVVSLARNIGGLGYRHPFGTLVLAATAVTSAALLVDVVRTNLASHRTVTSAAPVVASDSRVAVAALFLGWLVLGTGLSAAAALTTGKNTSQSRLVIALLIPAVGSAVLGLERLLATRRWRGVTVIWAMVVVAVAAVGLSTARSATFAERWDHCVATVAHIRTGAPTSFLVAADASYRALPLDVYVRRHGLADSAVWRVPPAHLESAGAGSSNNGLVRLRINRMLFNEVPETERTVADVRAASWLVFLDPSSIPANLRQSTGALDCGRIRFVPPGTPVRP